MGFSNRFRIFSSPVTRRVFLAVLLCSLLPIGCLVALNYYNVQQNLKQETARRLHHASKNIGMALVAELGRIEADMQLIASAHDSSASPAVDRSRMAMQATDALSKLRLLSPEDPVFFDVPALAAPMRAWVDDGNTQLQVLQSAEVGTELWLWTRGVDRSRQPVLIAGQISLDHMLEYALGFLPPRAILKVVSSRFARLMGDVDAPGLTRAQLSASTGYGHHLHQVSHAGEDWLVGQWGLFLRARFNAPSWYVFVSEPRQAAFASVITFARNAGLISILTFWVILLASSILVRKTLQPLQQLKDATERIGQGDYTQQLDLQSNDEFGDLSRSFDQMSGTIQHQLNQQQQMSIAVRNILGAIDVESIIQGTLEGMSRVLRSDLAAVVLFNQVVQDCASAWLTSPTDGHDIEQQLLVEYSKKELDQLHLSCGLCRRGTLEQFPGLLQPLVTHQVQTFVLFPVHAGKRLAGVLVLAYDQEPVSEDGLNARQLADQLGVALDNAHLVDSLDELNFGILTALARTVDANSRWTHGHSERVTNYALAIGREMGLEPAMLDDLHRAGLLHDLGKISVPSEILNKAGKLTAEEYEVMKIHPAEGARILEPVRVFDRVRPMIAQHHERWDGRGYPQGLQGEEIDLGARILAVADVYDAVYSDRPYREGWTQERVFAMLDEEAGAHFDPEVVAALYRAIPQVEATPADWARPNHATLQ